MAPWLSALLTLLGYIALMAVVIAVVFYLAIKAPFISKFFGILGLYVPGKDK